MVAPRTAPLVRAGEAAGGAIPASVGFSSSSGYALSNGKITATALDGVLTVALKTLAGADPSELDRVLCAFRDPTSTEGGVVVREITYPVSLIVNKRVGVVSSVPFRLWSFLFDDAGTVHPAVRNCFETTLVNILPFDEESQEDAVAIADDGDDENVFYSDVDIHGRAFRPVAYLDWNDGLVTPATWSIGPDRIQPYGIGTKRPGEVCKETSFQDSGVLTGTTTIPFDDSIPQEGEGISVANVFVLPTSPINVLDFEFSINCAYSVAATIVAALFKGDADAIAATWDNVAASNSPIQITLRHRRQAVHLGQIGYELRTGGSTAGTLTINGSSAARKLGGVAVTTCKVREYMV